mmetsp:Transcript_114419/g.296351  ORF Transcript_114419/g.296351 Transcript_114419/m.296351 type:complete len:613 (+) Transcript_114419:3-1841(+)
MPRAQDCCQWPAVPDSGGLSFRFPVMPMLLPVPARSMNVRQNNGGSPAVRKEHREAPQPVRKRKAEELTEGDAAVTSMRLETPTPKVAATPSVNAQKAAQLAQLVSVIGDTQAEPGALFQATSELRKALSTEAILPIQELIDVGGLPPLVSRLTDPNTPQESRIEAVWALTNVAMGTSAQTLAVVEAGAPAALLAALVAPDAAERYELCDQILWALGNIAGDDDVSLRDSLLNMGVVGNLGQFFSQMPTFAWGVPARSKILRTMTWLMSSLCKGSPPPALEEVDCCFDYFVQVLAGSQDSQMLSDAMWGLYYLLEGASGDEESAARVERLLSTGFASPEAVPRPPSPHPVITQIVRCTRRAGDARNPLPIPALHLLGSLVSLPKADITDVAIAAGAHQALRATLADSHAPVKVKGSAAWTLSNIAAGTQAQLQRLVDESGVWEALCHGMEKSTSKQIRSECAWAICNIARSGFMATSGKKVEPRKAFALLVGALKDHTWNATLQRALLDATETMLRCGDEIVQSKGLYENPFVAYAEELGLPYELEDLQKSEAGSMQRKAAYIVEAWFGPGVENEPPPSDEKTPSALSEKTPSARGGLTPGCSPMRAYKLGC